MTWLSQLVARFIQNHYREVAAAISSLLTQLKEACVELGITTESFDQYFADERKYLEGLKAPSPTTALKSQYVQALNDLSQCW